MKVAAGWRATLATRSAEGPALRSPPLRAGRRCQSNSRSVSLLEGSRAHSLLRGDPLLQDLQNSRGSRGSGQPLKSDSCSESAAKKGESRSSNKNWWVLEDGSVLRHGRRWWGEKWAVAVAWKEGAGRACRCVWGPVRCLHILLHRGQAAVARQT